MEKLKMRTPDFTDENITRIAELFPNCVTESRDESGKVKRAIDFDQLRQELSGSIVEGPQERYQLNWPGKREALLTANVPIAKTLRPCREESVDFDTTKNLFIEGDNLDALKLLQETYLGKVKMIYIDPPYNTGRNLIYKNDFSEDAESFLLKSNQVDSEGGRLVANPDTNGRFHSDWLAFMYSRIRLARNLLSDDGLFVCAMDESEISNTGKLCEEIFGDSNFIGSLVTRSNPQGRGKKNIDPTHEYHLVYAKQLDSIEELLVRRDSEDGNEYINFMRSGTNSRKFERPNRFYPMLVKDGKISCITKEEYTKIYTKENGFNDRHIKGLTKNYEKLGFDVIYPIAQNGEEKVWQRTFERAVKECANYVLEGRQIKTPRDSFETPKSLWVNDIHSNVAYGANLLKTIFDGHRVFDYSKSVFTVKDILSLAPEGIVVDFFSGSATTAHAVMKLNIEEERKSQFVLVQLPELATEESETFVAGYKSIAEVGKERIRRAGKKIKEEAGLMGKDLDIGFRVLKIDSSNMKDVYYSPDEQAQANLLDQVTNIKEDRTAEDLLFQVLLDWGVDLTLPIARERISTTENTESTERSNKTSAGSVPAVVNKEFEVFFVDENALAACFDDGISDGLIKELAKRQPLRVVFRDSGFATDAAKINAEQIFKQMSPATEVRSI
ncbi:MAG: site-specific DNA-methyltransferase [Pyrinomonadaceae bacterium]|nr:site-specific DNA-methyltransferase [Pyrinomonadaceae bacterium]